MPVTKLDHMYLGLYKYHYGTPMALPHSVSIVF